MKFIILILSVLLSGCIVLHDRNGRRYSNFAPVNDHYRQFLKAGGDPSNIPYLNSTNRDFEHTNGGTRLRYLDAADVETIGKKHRRFLLLFWLPGCPAQTGVVNLVRKGDSLGIPVYLVSLTYDTDRIRSVTTRLNYNNDIIFILPNSEGDYVIKKIIHFIQQTCPTCYTAYRDDVSWAQGLFFDAGKVPEVLFRVQDSTIQRLFRSELNKPELTKTIQP